MKQGTTTLPKFTSLKKRLNLPQYAVVGLLESVWMLTCQTADDGDLSKHSHQEIADYADYDGSATELIEAMVETRWLDRNGEQLMVHDWDEHCPKYVKDRKMKREQRGKKPLQCSMSENVGDIRGQLMTEKGQSPLFNAIQSESSQVDSMQGVDVVVDDSFSFGTFLYGELKQQANTLIEKLPKDYRAEHREEVWRITYVAMTIEGASLVKQWVRGIVRNKPGHVVDYLLGCVRKGCEQRKLDWQSIRARAPQCPPEPKPRILPLTSA